MLGSPNKGTNGGLARTPIPSHNTNKYRIHQNIIWACAKKKILFSNSRSIGRIHSIATFLLLSFFFCVFDLMPPCQSDVVFCCFFFFHQPSWMENLIIRRDSMEKFNRPWTIGVFGQSKAITRREDLYKRENRERELKSHSQALCVCVCVCCC